MLRCFLPLALLAAGCAGTPESDVVTVADLDLERYQGRWYDIADFPQPFQDGCTCTRADYTLGASGVAVRNSCRDGSVDGDVTSINGRAWRPDGAEPGKLKVSFFGPFSADYWVTELGDNYGYAVVTNPDRSALWVLSRTPAMDASVLEGIKARLVASGFDLSALAMVQHGGCPDEQ